MKLLLVKGSRLSPGLLLVFYIALAAGVCLPQAGCSSRNNPSHGDQAYFDAYVNETRTTIAWWKLQVDTAQLVRSARSPVDSIAPQATAADAATRRDEAGRTLREEYGLTADEMQAVIKGQINRKIEEELSRGRKRL